MNIHIEAFPQSCRYIQYCSFSTLVNHATVFRPKQLAFPCIFFYKFSCGAWAETKTDLFLRQNKDKSPRLFSSFLDHQYTNKDLRPSGESCCTRNLGYVMELQKFLVFATTWISSTSTKYLELSYIVVQSWWNLSSLVHNKNYKFIATTTARQWCCWKLHFPAIVQWKYALKEKLIFFCFWSLK